VPGVALFFASIGVTLLVAPRVPIYWDTFGYVTQAIAGDVGGLGLGRPVFTLFNQIVTRAWLAAGGSPWHVEVVLRAWCTLASCLAAPLTWGLARGCGLSDRAALIAGIAVACSPAFAHAGGAVLTDGPAATLFLAACVTAWGAGAPGGRDAPVRQIGPIASVVSGLLAGLAVGVREQSVLNAATFALMALAVPRRRRGRFLLLVGAGFVAAVLAPLVFVAVTQPGYVDTIRTWLAGMRHDGALKTFGWRDAASFAGWILSLGPLIVVAAVIALARRRVFWQPGSLLFALVVPGLLQLLLMSLFLGIGYSPRFLLTPFPVAIAIPGAVAIDAWIGGSRHRVVAAIAAFVLPIAVAVPFLRARSAPLEEIIREWPDRLAGLPPRAIVVTGQPCPAVPLVREILAHDPQRAAGVPEWRPICPGWAWPTDLGAELDGALREGRPIAIDLRPGVWVGAEQLRAREAAARYVERHQIADGKWLMVWR
jgi:hypothetical protein